MKKLLSLGLVTAMLLASVEFAFPQGSVYAEEVGGTQEISEVTPENSRGGRHR